MGRKEVITACMESPLYFTMPPRTRLEFVKRCEAQFYSSSNLREALLSWVRTGFFKSPENVAYGRFVTNSGTYR